ncbi:Copper chaperone CopZ [Saccharicrinis carchari]|uniref:Copper chaperone CopZ n=1 Tax=Saccharicrinis carchari TaxID=1168039 RepID=A0A521B4D3_SACCC|nr:cation transporter [Saccharicrinis carchari]SMO41540.1 Copper chaperone CopZ [Saccharicrinis carchari]
MKTFLFLMLLFVVACQSPQKKQSQSTTHETIETNAVASEDAVIFELAVDGMTCTGCEQTVIKSVESLDGVQWVTASHANAKVMVALNKTKPDTASVRQKINDTGYQVAAITQKENATE